MGHSDKAIHMLCHGGTSNSTSSANLPRCLPEALQLLSHDLNLNHKLPLSITTKLSTIVLSLNRSFLSPNGNDAVSIQFYAWQHLACLISLYLSTHV